MIMRVPIRRMTMNQQKMSKRKTAPMRQLGAPTQRIWKKRYTKKENGESNLTETGEAGRYNEEECIWGGR
jgi:hypothetical protein